jgi:hypothetical protein
LGPGLLSMSPQVSIDFLSWNVYFSMRLLVLGRVGDFLMFGFVLFFFLIFSRMILIFLFFYLLFKYWCVFFCFGCSLK